MSEQYQILKMSGVEIASAIQTRDLTSTDVVRSHIDYAKKVNPGLNAIVVSRYEQALADANVVDEAAGKEEQGEFAGVPCTIKECFSMEGMPQTAGLTSRKGFINTTDATAVVRYKKAGAIPLGVTNLSELCMWMESNNKVYGRTNNPYNPAHIVGGSSGGEGAIIGSGASVFGVGSDVGGSIRMPAFFNGVFGHKPSGGLVPNTGQWPIAHGQEALRFLTTGPICRRAEDLYPLVKLLSGSDDQDEGCLPWKLQDPKSVQLSELKVLNCLGNGAMSVDDELVRAQQGAATSLSKRGAHVQSFCDERLRRSFDIWSALLGSAHGGQFRIDMNESRASLAMQTLRWFIGRSDHMLPALVLAWVENAGKLMPGRTRAMIQLGRQFKEDLINTLGTDSVMLFPSYTRPAPVHDAPLRRPFDWVYAAIWNVMQFPVTQVPLGLASNGLPLGVQVIAAPGNDHLTLAVARQLELDHGGWVPPFER